MRFAEELIDETFGASSRRWALMLVAVGVGAAAAVWLTGRARSQAAEAVPPPPEPAPALEDQASTIAERARRAEGKIDSAWAKVSRPPAVMKKLPNPPHLRRRTSSDTTDN